MGKDLKGKELGVGISQRKDGLYTARFTDKKGKRKQKYFKKLQECRNWIADAQFNDEHGGIDALGDMSVDAWFEYWITEVKGSNVRPNTIKSYKQSFKIHIQKYIGSMLLKDVKPMHCQNIINNMAYNYKNSTIRQIRETMRGFFESAVENELIIKNPVTKAVKCTKGKKSEPKRALTIEEQRVFLESIRNNSNYNQYAFLLQTGLRVGEMIGLKWSDVDFHNKVIRIQRSMEYSCSDGEWRIGEPKSKSGYRNVPLTQEAVNILKKQKEKLSSLKVVPIEFSEFVFLSKKGEPITSSAYDSALTSLCDKIGIKRFSMHTLRHTFATRCIEAGMKPKTLQMILGHSNIGVTMNLYVHVTEEEKVKEVESIEQFLKII